MIDSRQLLNYNESKYRRLCKGVDIMTIEGVVTNYQKCQKYVLSNNVSSYLKYVDNEPFYVATDIYDVKTDKRMSTLNPKFVLFSAPGATGKSALAEYVAHRFNALYWDLSKLRLGTNSFSGSILQAIGPENYSDFVKNLNSSEVMLIVDALDEAEIISGRKMISSFISDIDASLTHHSSPSVFFFARTETAQYIASYCTENAIPFLHYEIGFFHEATAKDFVTRLITNKGSQPTRADIECVNTYYEVVKRNISDEECRSFLGYAPVLQAIAAHIKEHKNRQKLISDLQSQKDCVSVIMSIMHDLLAREQEDKFVSAFKERCADNHPEFNDWDSVYNEQEQLVRIVNYILFNDLSYENYKVATLPPQLIDDYQSMLSIFVPQHPFVRNEIDKQTSDNHLDFTGPAFRDYSLARLILDSDYDTLAQMYFEESQSKSFFPSQIFFDCYKALAGDKVCADHLSYVYDSFKAKATALERPYLQCAAIPDEAENLEQHIAVFGMINDPKIPKRADVIIELVVNNGELHFNQLAFGAIDEPNLSIHIGMSGMDTRIACSSIIAKQIYIDANSLTIESYNPDGCMLVAKDGFAGNLTNIEISGGSNLKVCSPNIHNCYKLIPYKYDFEDATALDITKFIHALRCILIEFRTHKKDALAKTAERIEYVTVGNSELKRNVLNFLKVSEILYEEAHLYKIDEAKMQDKGIFFAALARNDTVALDRVFREYLAWANSST